MNKKQAQRLPPESTLRFPCPHCLERERDGWMIRDENSSKFKCNRCRSEMSLQTAYKYIETGENLNKT